jgi:4'-phosphopantetheinyl transferase EntD
MKSSISHPDPMAMAALERMKKTTATGLEFERRNQKALAT